MMGNSQRKSGYGCEMAALVADWRSKWAAAPNTTAPLAPFGVVTLAAGGSEGNGQNMSLMRWAQVSLLAVRLPLVTISRFPRHGMQRHHVRSPLAGLERHAECTTPTPAPTSRQPHANFTPTAYRMRTTQHTEHATR